jgi:cation transport regulator ChaC
LYAIVDKGNDLAMHPWFFGYGSLVNRLTHDYSNAHPARIRGWRRAWRHVESRDVAFLTAVPDPEGEIDGLVAEVPGGDWAVLDAREFSYDRALAQDVTHPASADTLVHIYWAPPEKHARASRKNPVLMSYVEVVVQGYLR